MMTTTIHAGDDYGWRVEYDGSICLVRPLTAPAEAWLQAHTDGMWFGGALVVEPRYLDELSVGMRAAAS